MQFQTGTFQPFKAISEFNFGPLKGMTIKEGTTMDFDGTTLRMLGNEYGCPDFAIAIRAGFVVPRADTSAQPPKPTSKVEVKAATSFGETREPVKMGAVVEDEQVVGSLATTKGRREAAQDAHAQQVTRHPQVSPDPEVEAALMPEPPPPPRQLSAADVTQAAVAGQAMQGGRPLTVEEADAINAAKIHAELSKPVDTNYIKGGTRHDKLEEEDGGKKVGGGKYQLVTADGTSQGTVIGTVKSGKNSAKVGRDGEATRAAATDVTRATAATVEDGLQEQRVVEGIRGAAATTRAVQEGIRNVGAQVLPERPPIMVPPIRTAQSTVITEGEDIRKVGPNGHTGDVAEQAAGDELTELLPEALVAAPPSHQKPSAKKSDPNAEIAEIKAGWDKQRQWQKRVNEAVEFYGDWPAALEAICEIESPAVVKHIRSRLAKIQAEA